MLWFCFFVRPLIPLFWTSGDVFFGFQRPEWAVLFVLGRSLTITYLLIFTPSVTPTNLLVACMAAGPSIDLYH